MALSLAIGLFLVVAVGGAAYYFLFYDRGSVYERALALAKRGAYMDARSIIRPRVDRDPDDPRPHYYMSRVYAMEGNTDQELAHLRELKRIGRWTSQEFQAADILVRIGQLFYEDDRYSDAFDAYLEALNVDPSNETALAHVAFMAIGQGEFQLADGYFKRLIKIAPNVADYRIARGVGLAMMKNKEALEELTLGMTLQPRNQTAQFLTAMQAFREGAYERARELLEGLFGQLSDPYVLYVCNRLGAAVYYMCKDGARALSCAERCLSAAVKEEWEDEEYDARLSVAYLAIMNGDLEKASEHLLELEIRDPSDDLVMKISDFRMDLEEQVADVDRVSPRGFDFLTHMQDWVRRRFPDDAVYRLSGLAMSDTFDVMSFFTREGAARPRREAAVQVDPDELIERFNNLRGESFLAACQSLMANLGFRFQSQLPYRERDGADFIATSLQDKKVKALFRIRQWRNQPISDIFLRDQQNYMNELKVSQGFVVAGARLTSGAEAASQNLKKISIVNDMEFAELLQKIL